MTGQFLLSVVVTLLFVGRGQGHDFSYSYIESGKISQEEMQDEVPEDVDGASLTPDHPGQYSPTPQELDFLNSNLAYFPSPDDDGTYIRVDMAQTSAMEFHIGASVRPATLIMALPGFNFQPKRVSEKDVKFYLFTKKVKDTNGIELFVSKTNRPTIDNFWMNGADVKILCHGYQSSSQKPFPRLMMNAYMALEENLNVILVDWSGLASSLQYFTVAKETFGVGEQVAGLIRALINEKLVTLDLVHFIGHSLGAHVGGATGYTLKEGMKVGNLSRVTGLDPAGPGFCDQEIGQLQTTDAHFVDVIHTDDSAYCEGKLAWIWNRAKGKWGSDSTEGHSNFFPNGGRMQPGCGTGLTDTCSHSRAYYYMEESYNSTVPGTTVFKGCPCSAYKDYLSGKCECTSENIVIMGEFTPINRTQGKYFLKTGRKYPYSHVTG